MLVRSDSHWLYYRISPCIRSLKSTGMMLAVIDKKRRSCSVSRSLSAMRATTTDECERRAVPCRVHVRPPTAETGDIHQKV